MREVRLPAVDWSTIRGTAALIPVKVDWPEVRLTEDQAMANAVAAVNGDPTPFPDPTLFVVRIERPVVSIGPEST